MISGNDKNRNLTRLKRVFGFNLNSYGPYLSQQKDTRRYRSYKFAYPTLVGNARAICVIHPMI